MIGKVGSNFAELTILEGRTKRKLGLAQRHALALVDCERICQPHRNLLQHDHNATHGQVQARPQSAKGKRRAGDRRRGLGRRAGIGGGKDLAAGKCTSLGLDAA